LLCPWRIYITTSVMTGHWENGGEKMKIKTREEKKLKLEFFFFLESKSKLWSLCWVFFLNPNQSSDMLFPYVFLQQHDEFEWKFQNYMSKHKKEMYIYIILCLQTELFGYFRDWKWHYYFSHFFTVLMAFSYINWPVLTKKIQQWALMMEVNAL
jgi:hypothetical protein